MAREIALELLKILEEYSDRDHKLSKREILDLLSEKYDDVIEEKAFYRKMEELKSAGYRIVQTKGKYACYYIDIPRLTPSELLYLSAMILGSSDISSREANRLVSRLMAMPMHQLANSQFDEFKKKLKENNTKTDQINKFAIIFKALQSKSELLYKEVLDFDTCSFSPTKRGIPQDFSIINNQMEFIFNEAGKTKKYLLKNLIDVEEIL